MPNWCNNYLSIEGPAVDVVRFFNETKHKTDKDSPLVFNNHVPVWKDDKLIGEMDPNNDWGTKWDACDAYYCAGPEEAALEEAEKGGYALYFQTAWAPPCEWLKVITKLFPTIVFEMEYEEGGCEIYGVSKGEKGEYTDRYMPLGEYLEKFDEDYQDCLKDIKKMSQEDLIKYFSRIKHFTEWVQEEEELEEEPQLSINYNFWPLAGTIIEALEVKNLPLFISVDWGNEYNEQFKTRMREGK